ncbi:T4 family baseplate hub assembly chaperone [Rugosimonospora africana]|uniref:Uncharacterized protein n=1 Tax=Rugosimonospora africana TaxID=556532 RepID=A0A8J3VPI6_9ACTN|nr:hypothetical protein [Rugosimonospora africana]GIH14154.1 hypothetical protein Raf01_23260 [Rugosimonospora africana]
MSGLLPGGYWDSTGRLHRDFELAALTGREEELLATAGRPQTATLVTEVLSRCVRRLGGIRPVPPEVVRQLLVADRQYLLLQLRRATFGDAVRADLVCPWPECGQRVSIEFSIADVPVEPAPQPAPAYTMTLSAAALGREEARDGAVAKDGGSAEDGSSGKGDDIAGDDGAAEVVFRLPDGSDQEALSDRLARNEAEALTALLTRCVLRIGTGGPPDADRIARLSTVARAEIEEHMRRVAPRVEQTMEARCAECGRTFVAPFDIQRFFLGQLRTDGRLLYQEVHYLAYHYHWSEREIMDMTRDKRRTYIEVLADAIEVLNSGAR